jgi:perosamine synthetase
MKIIPKQIIEKIDINFYNRISNRKDSFLSEFKNYTDINGSIFLMGRARAALYHFLVQIFENNNKREVIVSAYTLLDIINIIKLAGGEPIFADLEDSSTALDFQHILHLSGENTAAIIITHQHVPDRNTKIICEHFKDSSVYTFEDCAIGFGSFSEGNSHVGKLADAALFSFSSFKSINYFWGGALVINNLDLYLKMEAKLENFNELRFIKYNKQIYNYLKFRILTSKFIFSYFIFPILRRKVTSSAGQLVKFRRAETKIIDETFFAKPNWRATHSWSKCFERAKKLIIHRRLIASIYASQLNDYAVDIYTPKKGIVLGAFNYFPIQVNRYDRNKILIELLLNKIDAGKSLYPDCSTYFQDKKNSLNKTEGLVEGMICLPIHSGIDVEKAKEISTKVKRIILSVK